MIVIQPRDEGRSDAAATPAHLRQACAGTPDNPPRGSPLHLEKDAALGGPCERSRKKGVHGFTSQRARTDSLEESRQGEGICRATS